MAPCRPGYWRITVVTDGMIGGRGFHFEDHSMVRSVAAGECR